MKPRLPILIALAAALALASPVDAQEREAPQIVPDASHPAPSATLPLAVLERRIDEARQTHHHNRLLGTGLIAAGALAVAGSFADWAIRDDIGMRPAAAGLLLGGVNLVAWGGSRHRVARQALRQAETWEVRLGEDRQRP